MRVTLKKVIGLALVLVISTSAAVWLNLPQPDVSSASDTVYYFANYDSADDILAVQIDSAGSAVTLIHSDGDYYAYLGDNEVSPVPDAIEDLFREIYRLPLESYIAGAVSKDPQYGLDAPQAEVYIQNNAGDAFYFYIGKASPSGGAYYVCLSGDERVFLMSGAYAELFLSGTDRYYSE